MRVARWAVGLAVALAMLVQARPAFAPYHFVVIEEVFFGTEDCPNAQYVMLRTQAIFQTFVVNQTIRNQDATGADAGLFGTFTRNLPRTDQGVAMIMGTTEAQGLFGIPFDQLTPDPLVSPAGRVCFGSFEGNPVDCVAFGAFTGANPGGGAPAPAPELGMALVRVSETDSDADDFQLAAPMPENNGGQIGQLGQCPPPTATPTVRPTLPPDDYVCPGDCNRDREVAITEVVTSLNISLAQTGVERCLDTDADGDGEVQVDELLAAVRSGLDGCPPLGTRRFSLNPDSSPFIAVVAGLPVRTDGFEGFLELQAGVPNATGLAFVDLVNASEYLSVYIPPQSGTEGLAVCIRPRRDLLPVRSAGVVDCDGAPVFPFNLMTTQDHNIGMVGACAGGDNANAACAADAECPGGECFSNADCAAAGGSVETVAHPNVCNGRLSGDIFGEDVGPGGVLIAEDTETMFINGFPAELIMEEALPCGDEGASGIQTRFALTTGISRAQVLHLDNMGEQSATYEVRGENFSCRAWAQEDGRGTLVVAVPTLDVDITLGLRSDLLSVFVLDD